jgi:cell fate regulator YaaT (PSP1 superfamily)
MKIVEVQFTLWDKPTNCLAGDFEVGLGDYIIAEFGENLEIGKIIGIVEEDEKQVKKENSEIKTLIRKADLKDFEKLEIFEKQKTDAIENCKKYVDKYDLPMKMVDVHFSFDDKKVTFAFIAESRVDFRQLVKDLTRQFQKSIRLQQLGVRDEAKINGDIGACGIKQCCKTHLKELGNVSAEQAELQQVSHRGAERLSGICNRLKCCLRYENEAYKELSGKFPEVGSQIKTPNGKGEVIENLILKEAVRVKLEKDDGGIMEVPLTEIK